jgi:hypothetical protein
MLLPAVQKVREAANRSTCQNNVKQLVLGAMNCIGANKDIMPPSIGLYANAAQASQQNSNGGFFLHILPFIEQEALYKSSLRTPDPDGRNGGFPTYSQWTPDVQNSRLKILICPTDPTNAANQWGGRSSYAVNGQIFRHAYPGWGLPLYSLNLIVSGDGLSNTIFVTEKLSLGDRGSYPDNFWPDWGSTVTSSDLGMPTGAAAGPQTFSRMSGANAFNIDGGRASTAHASIVTGFGDGSVRLTSQSVNPTQWWWAFTPNGQEVLTNW